MFHAWLYTKQADYMSLGGKFKERCKWREREREREGGGGGVIAFFASLHVDTGTIYNRDPSNGQFRGSSTDGSLCS